MGQYIVTSDFLLTDRMAGLDKRMKTGKKVLVTGADGFIGSHLVEELGKKRYQVRAFVYYNLSGKILRYHLPNV